MKQQQIMAMKDLIRKIRSKGSIDAKTVGGSRSCLRKIVRKHGPTQDGRTPCRNGMNGRSTRRRKMKKEKWRRCISERWKI